MVDKASRRFDYDILIIGSGFGGSMVALSLVHKLKAKGKYPKVRILERGTWWTTPVSTVQDKNVATHSFLKKQQQPVQFWSSVEHLRGLIDIITRCLRRPRNEDGLYDMTQLGKRGLLGFVGGENDGVSILRANGVGGGSLVYSNITIRPPNFVLEDSRWPLTWTAAERTHYFELARHAIGYGVVSAWTEEAQGNIPYKDPSGKQALPKGAVNAGLSNIVTRSARLNPHWDVAHDPKDGREVMRIRIAGSQPGDPPPPPPDHQNRYWIDRARIFQSAMHALGVEHGTVDSSINDITPEGSPLDPLAPANYPGGNPINYCERQGRCNVGCLPGARHTLNKQLMVAIFGKPDGTPPLFPNLSLEALAEVDVIEALPEGGYAVHYWKRDEARPSKKTMNTVRARRIVLAAGCLGTNEIMLRSKERGTLPDLSDKLGFGFSTNGDYIAFVDDMPVKVGLSRGPVTTSFAHFHSTESDPTADSTKFHILEDQGVPRALTSTIGFGVPLIRSLSNGRHRQPIFLLIWTLMLWTWNRLLRMIRAIRLNSQERQREFESEDEFTANMMCVVAAGREASVGQFRLGRGRRETSLRVRRTDGKAFHEDPIYKEIRESLDRLGKELGSQQRFQNPFLNETSDTLEASSITLSHPLGGCRMAKTASEGVVDEFGRVFKKSAPAGRPYHEGLYITDGAAIPTALAVNPSLTISALALRMADRLATEIEQDI